MKNTIIALLFSSMLGSINLSAQCVCFEFQITQNPDSACLYDINVLRFASCGAASPVNQVSITVTDTASQITEAFPSPAGVEVVFNADHTEAVFTTDFNLESLTLNVPRFIGSFKLASSNQVSNLSGALSGAPPVGTVCTFANFVFDVPCLKTTNYTFEKLYGNGNDNFPTKVKGFNGFTYVLSTNRTAAGDFAVFSKFNNAGVLFWEYQLDIQSQLLDFEFVPSTPTAGQYFLLVGRTEPTNIAGVLQDNASLLVKIQDLGNSAALTFSRKFAHTGRESFTRIIRHTNALPASTPFEYYILGHKNLVLPASSTDQPMLYNINASGASRPGFPKEYFYQFELEGHLGMFQKANGNVVILGDAAPTNDGILIEINGQSGAVVANGAYKYNNANNTAQYDFWDGMELPNGQIVIGGTDVFNREGILLTLNNAFLPLYGIRFKNISEIHEIGRDPFGAASYEILYIIGPAKQALDFPVVARVVTSFSWFSVIWAKYFQDPNELDYKDPHFSVTPTAQRIFYADSRETQTVNNWDMLVGAYNLNLNLTPPAQQMCLYDFAKDTFHFLPVRTPIMVTDKFLNQSISDMGTLVAPGYACTMFCSSSPCNIPVLCSNPPNVTVNTDPGKCTAAVPISVSGTGCGPMSIFMNATGATTFTDSDFGVGNSITLSGTYTFNKGVTNVTVTVTATNGTATCTFSVTVIDNEPPKIICPQNVSVTAPFCDGGANVNFLPPTVTDNCPMVNFFCSHQSGQFFPCGKTTVTCTATDMSQLTSTCTFDVFVDCQCAQITATTIDCDPSMVNDKYVFTITVQSLSGATNCTATAVGTQTGVIVTAAPITFTNTGTITGMITVPSGVIPSTFTLNVNVQCVCPNGAISNCTLPVSLIPVCCKYIYLADQSVCANDPQVSVPIIGCAQFSCIQQVNYYVASGPTCPPWTGPGSAGWTLAQSGLNCAPLVLYPAQYTDNIWVQATMIVCDYPCTIVPSKNIACITLCRPATCSITADQNHCYMGSPITPTQLMASFNPPNSILCPASVTLWSGPGVTGSPSGNTFQPPNLSLPVGFTGCFMDFVYTATVHSLCGDQTCSANIRLYNDAASIGDLDLQWPEPPPIPYCPGEDFTMEFKPACTSLNPPTLPGTWTWCESTNGTTFTPIAGSGSMNPVWMTNPLTADHWYQVKSQNGVCPPKNDTYFIDIRDPFTLGIFTAVPQMVAPDCDVTGVDMMVSFTGIDANCPAIVQWIKDGNVIFTSTWTGSSATWTYIDPLLLGNYEGNYWVVVKRVCCDEVIASNLVTIQPPCFVKIYGDCCIFPNGTATLTGVLINPPAPPVTCTSQWYEYTGGVLVPIGLPNMNQVTVNHPGIYLYKVICSNGCVKCEYFFLQMCVDCEKQSLLVCSMGDLKNGSFSQGTVNGELGAGGQVNDWALFPNTGNGKVTANSGTGSGNAGFLTFNGNQDNFAGIVQQFTLPGSVADTFAIRFDFKNELDEEIPPGTELEFRLQKEPTLGSQSQILLRHNINRTSTGWQVHAESVVIQPDPSFSWLVVCLKNGIGTSNSVVSLDNLEICEGNLIVGTEEPSSNHTFRLFPNPTTGELTIEWPGLEMKNGSIELISSLGQTIRRLPVPDGSTNLNTRVDDLPEGFYFVKIHAAGRQLKALKFVKQ